jgi:hypothetical protein
MMVSFSVSNYTEEVVEITIHIHRHRSLMRAAVSTGLPDCFAGSISLIYGDGPGFIRA